MTRQEPNGHTPANEIFLSWWLFAVIAGALSIVSIAQSVAPEYAMVMPLQWLMDRFREGLEALGRPVEPYVLPLVQAFGDLFHWKLTLLPHWRPLFVLALVLILVLARQFWGGGRRSMIAPALFLAVVFGLAGALAGGSQPLEPSPSVNGILTGLSFFMVCLAFGLAMMRHQISLLDRQNPITVIFVSLCAFVLAPLFLTLSLWTGVSAAALSAASAGLTSLGLLTVIFALIFLIMGIVQRNGTDVRVGLIILGPFLGAVIITVFDWSLKIPL